MGEADFSFRWEFLLNHSIFILVKIHNFSRVADWVLEKVLWLFNMFSTGANSIFPSYNLLPFARSPSHDSHNSTARMCNILYSQINKTKQNWVTHSNRHEFKFEWVSAFANVFNFTFNKKIYYLTTARSLCSVHINAHTVGKVYDFTQRQQISQRCRKENILRVKYSRCTAAVWHLSWSIFVIWKSCTPRNREFLWVFWSTVEDDKMFIDLLFVTLRPSLYLR